MTARPNGMDEFRRARDHVQRMNAADRQRADTATEAPAEWRDLDEREGGAA